MYNPLYILYYIIVCGISGICCGISGISGICCGISGISGICCDICGILL